MGGVRACFLGGFGLATDDGRPVRIRLRKHRALLAWLATAPDMRRSREAAVSLLWADSDDQHAAASLSQALYSLRKEFAAAGADPVRIEGETLVLPAGSISVDVAEFAALAGGGERSGLERAKDLYHGDFLEGFPPPSERFEEWLQNERRWLRGLATDVMSGLLAVTEGEEGSDAYGRTASRLLGLDPYSDRAVRALMRHHARRERVALATETLEVFRARLVADLDVAPDARTLDLHEAILNGAYRPNAAMPAAIIHGTGAFPARAGSRSGVRQVIVSGLALLTALAATLYLMGTDPPADQADVPPGEASLAVVPFSNLGDDGESALLAQGLSKDLATALARLPQVFVSAGDAAAGANRAHARATAERLGVRYLVDGDVQRSGDRVRVTARLIDALGERYVWSTRFERPIGEFFGVQDDLVLGIAAELRGQLEPGERLRQTRDTDDLASWLASTEAYGEFLEFTPAGNARARDLWGTALALDPERALPHAGLALTHYQDALRGWSADRAQSIALGTEHAEAALGRNPELPLAYQALGALEVLRGNAATGIRLRRKAVELAPNDFSAVGGLAALLSGLGEADEAVGLFRHVLRLNPRPPLWVPIWFGHALHVSGRNDEAAVWLERAIERSPKRAHVHARLAAVYEDQGRTEAASAAVRRAIGLDPGVSAKGVAGVFSIPGSEFAGWMEARLSKAGLPD